MKLMPGYVARVAHVDAQLRGEEQEGGLAVGELQTHLHTLRDPHFQHGSSSAGRPSSLQFGHLKILDVLR
jgi:hypothetical protein